MKTLFTLLTVAALSCTRAFSADTAAPPATPEIVFGERDGVIALKAEHFFRQTLTKKRAWHITSPRHTPGTKPDADEPHLAGASGGAYFEALPDTRATPGANTGCPDGDAATRAKIFAEHLRDNIGLLYFLQNDDEVPAKSLAHRSIRNHLRQRRAARPSRLCRRAMVGHRGRSAWSAPDARQERGRQIVGQYYEANVRSRRVRRNQSAPGCC